LLSGRIIGVGGDLARGSPSRLWGSMLVAILVALPVWGVIDAIGRPARHWEQIGRSKGAWMAAMALGAPIGVGFVIAAVYFSRVRPLLSAAEIQAAVAIVGDEVAR